MSLNLKLIWTNIYKNWRFSVMKTNSFICSAYIESFLHAMSYVSFYRFYFTVKDFLGGLADQSHYFFMEIMDIRFII